MISRLLQKLTQLVEDDNFNPSLLSTVLLDFNTVENEKDQEESEQFIFSLKILVLKTVLHVLAKNPEALGSCEMLTNATICSYTIVYIMNERVSGIVERYINLTEDKTKSDSIVAQALLEVLGQSIFTRVLSVCQIPALLSKVQGKLFERMLKVKKEGGDISKQS